MPNSYLIDTHTLLWFLSGDSSISNQAKSLIQNSENQCLISIASLWEIAIKIKFNKLTLAINFEELSEFLSQHNIEVLQINFKHLCILMELDDIHRDPFDRIIISTAKSERIPIITKDSNFPKYEGLEVIW